MTWHAISRWDDLDLSDVLSAYRKAKVDCFYERSFYVSERFAEYEKNLWANLSSLLDALRSGKLPELIRDHLGNPRVFAKRLLAQRARGRRDNDHHGFFSDADRAFASLRETCILEPEFRLVGDFPVVMHIVSALWINCVGHKYDASLSGTSFGSRLRRYRSRAVHEERAAGGYHRESLGSFEPYFKPYKEWRDLGLAEIQRALTEERSVIAVTLDFSSYYHNIDPQFLVNEGFLSAAGVALTPWELDFTRALVDGLQEWGRRALAYAPAIAGRRAIGGLPIGLSAVRIITNVLLVEFDRAVKERLAPLYYGRYVDDVFLVLQDDARIRSSAQLWDFIIEKASIFQRRDAYHIDGAVDGEDADFDDAGAVEVVLPGDYQGRTKLLLQPSKQKVFFLQGASGLDLLSNIAAQIRNLSSERRLMPVLEDLETTQAARVLSAAAHPADEADSLRRADGLTLRRLGWAVQLRSFEILARDLDNRSWVDERAKFYKFARNHVLRADKILEQLDYIPRLISLAVSLSDWEEAGKLIGATETALGRLRDATGSGRHRVNGVQARASLDLYWEDLQRRVLEACRDAVLRSIPWDASKGEPKPLAKHALAVCHRVGLGRRAKDILATALLIRECDLAKVAHKVHLRCDAGRQRPKDIGEEDLATAYPYVADLSDFLVKTSYGQGGGIVRRVHQRCLQSDQGEEPSILPYLVPTRAYSAQEVALYLPHECVFDLPEASVEAWAKYLRAVRGIWPREGFNSDTLEGAEQSEEGGEPAARAPSAPCAVIGKSRKPGQIRLGITSLMTTEESWSKGASGAPDLSPERYKRLVTVVNQAIKADPKPTHLLLPELSLPERWIGTVASILEEARISLIAGVDYAIERDESRASRERHENDSTVWSSAVLMLLDDRLGYPTTVQIRQPKVLPAPNEEENLLRLHGLAWRDWGSIGKPVYDHDGFCFGVLVCSELQNMEHRRRFQGEVDSLMVLSWNSDLETFSALVEAASLDVHAYVALVNNRSYGDSRVRAPAKRQYDRDVCRIRGGRNDHLVVVEIKVDDLRAQQSRSRRWSRSTDKYKPAPEGFKISDRREAIPK